MPEYEASMRVAVVVPVRNGGEVWRRAATAIHQQRRRPDRVLVMDTESTDGSDAIAQACGFELRRILARDFDHGGTRRLAAELCSDCEVLVYLTHDAVLADAQSLGRLLRAFEDPQVAVAYGRQLARPDAGPIEAHARLFNYPLTSARRTLADAARLGLKAAFSSDSFCAYRRDALERVGNFPVRAIGSEDMVVAARVLQGGMAVAYIGDACVFHSHADTAMQELRRYFDIGVLHAQEPWLLRELGRPEGEGLRFVLSEIRYLLHRGPWLLPAAIMRTVGKLVGYRLGRAHARLPLTWRLRLSMHRGFWSLGP